MRIAILGTGTMGKAFHKGLMEHLPEAELLLCDTQPASFAGLQSALSSSDPNEIIPDADVVFFAVKPQSFDELVKSITVPLEEKLVVSIMAGIPIERLAAATKCKNIVRSMPNLGAQVGTCLTAWIATPECSAQQRAHAERIFGAVGTAIEVEEESMLDSFTALAGSGPAYFFLLAELLTENAKRLGFSEEESLMIGRDTLIASALLLKESSKMPSEWRAMVTSKGGTTEAAVKMFEEKELPEIVEAAVEAAVRRAGELRRA